MVNKILTNEQVRKAIYVDYDYDQEELTRLNELASSYIFEKTGYDWGADTDKHSLAVQCAILYIRHQYFGGEGYNKDHDYSLGISSLLIDLKVIASERAEVSD